MCGLHCDHDDGVTLHIMQSTCEITLLLVRLQARWLTEYSIQLKNSAKQFRRGKSTPLLFHMH